MKDGPDVDVHAIYNLRRQQLKDAVRRDVLFLIGGVIAYIIVAYVETYASDDQIRLKNIMQSLSEDDADVCAEHGDACHVHHSTPSTGIIDAGFIVTRPLHAYLSRNRDVNDLLAMANSVLLSVPIAYVVYVTVWKGDFRLSFRLIATHLFRTCCGWFTYLPPPSNFIPSVYDFPEMLLCLYQECSVDNVDVSFLTFFSGHVATIVIIANYLYRANHTRLAVCLHCFNWLQAIRLLATRGHYSIDLIIGYVVAVFVSHPAERLGLYYSWGIQPPLPTGVLETFEILVGVSSSEPRSNDVHHSQRQLDETKEGGSASAKPSVHDNSHHVQSETSIRIAVNIVADIAMKRSESSPALTSG